MDKAFITVTPDTGQNNGTLSVNADKNENYVSRYATFKVEGGGITKSVSIEQDPNPYIYIDCGYIFSNTNIQEPYRLTHDNGITSLIFNVKFADFILSSRHLFIIKKLRLNEIIQCTQLFNLLCEKADDVYGGSYLLLKM